MTNIVLIGAPGSGKTTLAEAFAGSDGLIPRYLHISSGRIAADQARQDSHAQEALRRGDYAPESAIRLEVESQVESAISLGRPFILDGFPRRIDQLFFLERILPASPLYVWLHVDGLTCIRRIVLRHREFDEPDALHSRYEAYDRDTRSMLRLLIPSLDHFKQVDNNGTLDEGLTKLKDLL